MADDDHVQRIVDLAGWHGPRAPRLDWPAIEAALGHPLPSDYKRLCERLPPGGFGEFLNLLHPASVGDFGNLITGERSLKQPGGIVDMLVEQERIYTEEANARRLTTVEPAAEDGEKWRPLFGPGQLHPCFWTDNGGYGFWIAAKSDPEEWTIGVNLRSGNDVEPYELSLSSFLHEMLTDEYAFRDFFGADGPDGVVFEPYESGVRQLPPP
ncbi:hypothetical protein AAH979_41935 [Plantactinospora sp. ZYX-F-223]|uniref:hypothetical protein n=1 Tax=Plantactinospora sp. ZYX-F-223 TaxID=3144103 RepID=UPI0031FCB5B9